MSSLKIQILEYLNLFSNKEKTISQEIYNFIHNLKENPLCLYYKKKRVKYLNLKEWYSTYCYKQCADSCPISRQKRSETVKNFSPERKELERKKREETFTEKYGEGITNVMHVQEFKYKILDTWDKKFWWHLQFDTEIRKKTRENYLKNYWVNHYSQYKTFLKYLEKNKFNYKRLNFRRL